MKKKKKGGFKNRPIFEEGNPHYLPSVTNNYGLYELNGK